MPARSATGPSDYRPGRAANYCHLTVAVGPLAPRLLREAQALRTERTPVIIIAPETGTCDVPAGINLVTYRRHVLLLRVFVAYFWALRWRAQVYHLHDPELLILGWCFRLFIKAAVIYDAQRPTFHYFLWKYGPSTFFLRHKAAVLKLIEIVGVIFIDGLIVAAPRSLQGIGRFCPRRIVLNDFAPAGPPAVAPQPEPVLIYRGLCAAPVKLNLILEAFFQLCLETPVRLVLAGTVPAEQIPALERELRELRLTENVIRAGDEDWHDYCGAATVGLATPNDDDFFRRGEQPEIYEYLAAGIPVVAGRTPFTEAAVAERETGLVLKTLTPLNIKSAVLRLLADPAARRRMGANGRRLSAGEYSWDRAAERLVAFYQGLFTA